jgi:hypothetical protein
LIDKLTGKLSEELRGGKGGKLPPIDGIRDGLASRGSHRSTSKMIDGADKDDEETKKDTT